MKLHRCRRTNCLLAACAAATLIVESQVVWGALPSQINWIRQVIIVEAGEQFIA